MDAQRRLRLLCPQIVVLTWGISQRDLEAVERILSQVRHLKPVSPPCELLSIAVDCICEAFSLFKPRTRHVRVYLN